MLICSCNDSPGYHDVSSAKRADDSRKRKHALTTAKLVKQPQKSFQQNIVGQVKSTAQREHFRTTASAEQFYSVRHDHDISVEGLEEFYNVAGTETAKRAKTASPHDKAVFAAPDALVPHGDAAEAAEDRFCLCANCCV